MDAASVGSSPLARGLPGVDNYLVTLDRIIPARAGFTKRDFSQVPGGEDHPRSRGVYFGLGLADPGGSRIIPARAVYSRYAAIFSVEFGSSPLARGLPVIRVYAVHPRRIIPARAGFTGSRLIAALPDWDHPRSRGVYG